MIKGKLESLYGKLKPYTELRVQENRNITLALMDGNLVRNEKTTTSGVSARTFNNGYWGFASDPEVNDSTIERVLDIAEKNASFLASKGGEKQAVHKAEMVSESHDFSTRKERWTQDETIDFMKSVDGYISTTYPQLKSRMIYLVGIDMEKELITSDCSNSYLNWPRSVLYIMMTLENDGIPCEMTASFGGRGHLEDNFSTVDVLKGGLDKLYDELSKKNMGVVPIAGTHDVILDADLAGILAHEALGHTAEADLVRNGSIAGDYLNKRVASELITLVDFAHTYKDDLLPVPVFIDDEGIVSKDAMIIENGILKNFMHNRDSAVEFDMENTGNARAWQYSDEPLIRMRNTCILPGKSKLEDMIASIEDGYYFTKTNNGQADTTGEFMFGVSGGYEIKNGKLGKAIKDTTISGKAFDVLSSVTMVSDEMKWSAGGMCGKKQPIPTGMGGPAIKCKINVGGQ
ncbi:MAG: TldD/PmbA family protein [Clostridiales bacterium]|nr:TldD/PmbA family protein [Clostridiales bacterium]